MKVELRFASQLLYAIVSAALAIRVALPCQIAVWFNELQVR